MSKKSTATDGQTRVVESKADRFRRLANARLGKFEKLSRMIAALANRSAYDYTSDQRAVIESVVDSAANRVLTSFANGSVPKDDVVNYV